MKATFDILRRWSYPLVPEIMTSMHKQTLSTITTTPSSPQIKLNDPYLSFYNIFYPIIYDKHNIYKQGDIQLDRLSNIQQDIFIGHKTQILSGVCLRSSLIGQNCIIGKNTQIENSILWNHVRIGDNCIIKNSIICDNVLIRDNVQIDKECILCKGVIIGTNIHLNEHHTIISSNSTTSSSSVIDEIEIDDDIQLTPENFKRSNSKLNRSSTRSSDKSFSDKSICSSVEETITSNSDLVGIDGLGTELIFTSGHDDQIKTFEHTDDDDDDEDDNDKKQLNAFDAWGYRREPIENNDIFIEFEIENQSYRNSMMKTSPNQPQNIESGSTTPDINKSLSSSTETSSVISGPNDVSEFQDEVIRTLKRAYTQKLKIENIIVELNMLKPTYDVSPTEFDQSITRAVFLLPFENKIANTEKPNYINTLKLTLDQLTQFILKNYMKTTNEQAQMTLLNELDLICLKHIQPIGERIVNILDYLYDKDVLDEQWILKWYKNKQDKIEKNEILIKPEDKIYYDKLKEFIQWLQNAESDDDDDED
jgi:carbonic anhydrase/acetyltransferase-like protein (isoleucine patch superfamily)